MSSSGAPRKSLAIVGAGSSGLVTLFYALRRLAGWRITCFERSGTVHGAWGDPHPGFVSTSTKYTTQFSCHRRWEATADPEGDRRKADFFRDGEYGEYLDDFVGEKGLAPHIRHHHEVRRIERVDGRWRLEVIHLSDAEGEATSGDDTPEDFDALVLCTGLAERPKPIESALEGGAEHDPEQNLEQLVTFDPLQPPKGRRIVVVGGGETAVDLADRLAEPTLGNEVFLSLSSGVRVSPRYHPIRGVPSDFLRTRLMLSISLGLRNAVGQKFVEARIRHQELFERLSRRKGRDQGSATVRERRKYWASKLTEKAKDSLFNMFHNKSDDFLDAVAEGRIQIIGPSLDASYRRYADFEGAHPLDIEPDLLVPAIGFTSKLATLSRGAIVPSDFHLGCIHREHDNLFLVGFARPILGNIPTISEMQAQYVTGLIAGRHQRPDGLAEAHRREREWLAQTFPKLNLEGMYPVEMFPYCDRLSRLMGTYPSRRKVRSLNGWLKTWLTSASTTQYLDENYDPDFTTRQPIHIPPVLAVLLWLIKLADWIASGLRSPELR